MKFQDDISNMNTYTHTHTYIHTYIRTSRNQYVPPPLFQSWGHNNRIHGMEMDYMILFENCFFRTMRYAKLFLKDGARRVVPKVCTV